MTSIAEYLKKHGPSRSANVVEALVKSGLSPEAARQRVSRVKPPVRKFPVPLLPKKEAFLYLQEDRGSERFWENFLRDMRESGSVFAAAIDGMAARGGLVKVEDFAVISSASVYPQKGQLFVDTVASRLIAADFIKEINDVDLGRCFVLHYAFGYSTSNTQRARDLTERVLLDGMREWARKIGLASYNSIRVRGDADLKPIGPFAFDLAGPSYLLPLQRGAGKPGFIVADVFSEGILTVDQVNYFIRKSRMLASSLRDVGCLSIIVAQGFTGEALKAGHAAGVVMSTPKDLFGRRVGEAISSLVEVLKNAAAYAASSPGRLTQLLDNLFDIEGRSGNLRGILFELVAAYLIRRTGGSIDMNVTARDPETGHTAEIDVQQVANQASDVLAIESKGKEPGGVLSREEVETWLKKTAIWRAHYRSHPTLYASKLRFEIWTSGTIAPDALALLESEKVKRTKVPIGWKDGEAVFDVAREGKEKGIADALRQHFLRHPFADVANKMAADLAAGISLPFWPTQDAASGSPSPAVPALPAPAAPQNLYAMDDAINAAE
jgi:hypothetical protein